MKRVAVLSFHKTTNYGCALQQAALSKAISRFGYDVTFIANTQTPRLKRIYRLKLSNIIAKVSKKIFKRNKPQKKTLDYDGMRVKIFRDFQSDVLNVSDECSCYSDFRALNNQFDAFVCGSDQIWSPSWFDEKYFLPFVDDKEKLIAYAPSFGVSSVDDREIGEFMSEAISRFAHLSVREKQGVEIIRKLTGREAAHVLDPTLLLTPDEWADIIGTPETGITGKYIICYFLGDTEKYVKSVKSLSVKLGIPAYIIPVYDTDMNLNIAKVDYPVGPREFVSLIKNAEYVCTDSFHGAVFSLNFGKPFAVFERDSKKNKASMNSRLYSLLDTFNLRDRLVNYNDTSSITSLSDMDSFAVAQRLGELRKESAAYLENALREATSHACTDKKSLAEYNPSEIKNYVIDKDLCSGCSACTTVCPTGALSIEMNAAGFRHYVIDKEKCVNCGQCKKVCPMQGNTATDIMTGRLYGVKANDKAVLTKSSSGGMCHLLAEYLNSDGYYVAGCRYNAERGCAEHAIAPPDCPEMIASFQGSKYIQSDMGVVFTEILKLDKAAFFGTPCQVAGLHKLLVKEGKRDAFVLVEVICRGVPSMNVWTKYVEETRHNMRLSDTNGIEAFFRSNKLGWNPLTITMRKGKTEQTEDENRSDFYSLFLNSDSLCESCYECPYRTRSYADIRVGDFWGRAYRGDPYGVSETIVMTEKGNSVLSAFSDTGSAEIREFPIDELHFSQCLSNSKKPLFYSRIITDLHGKASLHTIRKKYYNDMDVKKKLLPLVKPIIRILKRSKK